MAAINWEDEYGEKWTDMTPEQKETATVKMFSDLRKGQTELLEAFTIFCKDQKIKNDRFTNAFWIAVLGIPGAFSAITIIAVALINHIGK